MQQTIPIRNRAGLGRDWPMELDELMVQVEAKVREVLAFAPVRFLTVVVEGFPVEPRRVNGARAEEV
jgi:hypothetical protein